MRQDGNAGRRRHHVIDGGRQPLRLCRSPRRRRADPAPHRSAAWPKILERLNEGAAPAAILKDFEKSEAGIGWRQLAIIDAEGQAAFFNGAKIYSVSKGRIGRDCVAVGNILRNTDVVDAMVQSFEANEEQPLAERLMRAIEAGDAAAAS